MRRKNEAWDKKEFESLLHPYLHLLLVLCFHIIALARSSPEYGDGNDERWIRPARCGCNPNGEYAYVTSDSSSPKFGLEGRYGLGEKHGYELGGDERNRWK